LVWSEGNAHGQGGGSDRELGLQHLVGPLRLRGLVAILARIKKQIREKRVRH